MKTTHAKLSINGVLAIMKPGQRYTASQLADRLKMPITSVRLVLATDVALARLDTHSAHRGRMYSLAGTSRAADAHVDTRIRPDFTSNLTGYVSGLEAHRALAMMTRGVR
ncbi:hypothetical protein [Burkholderia gladioli]|uniref:hypothetical protein n=1 Tax=Burkholderia gladioli TaxID=28095 RepID=UPI001C24CBFD|nr:hypothetical protein [Burkholderia gladioli]MBU9175820.1 hypothetical protein [Burkholderia gladioli]